MDPMDKYDITKLTDKKTQAPNSMDVSITWVDGRIPFFKSKYFFKQGHAWYGICAFFEKIWAVTPLDYGIPSMITSIQVSPHDNYCEKAFSCLCFSCPLNQFDRRVFENEFKDCGSFSLGLPQGIGDKPLWFNEGKWGELWAKLLIPVQGGQLKFDEEKGKKLDT